MKILYYDCFSGISGDMNLGAMIDLGVDADYLVAQLQKLNLRGYQIIVSKDIRKGISGTKVDVILSEPTPAVLLPTISLPEKKHKSLNKLEHHHEHRSFSVIKKIIENSQLSDFVKEKSIHIFQKVAEAEGKIHNKPVEEVHFHEVGAIDSIVDIVGASICLEALKVDKIMASSVQLGGGMVKCTHGVYPVPAPATAEILKGIPVKTGVVDFEATTPTGAAILATLVDEFTDQYNFTIIKSAYGIGHKDAAIPNVLRVYLAEEAVAISNSPAPSVHEHLITECNIDDMNPEFYDYLFEKLFEAGADDVFITPIIMKKSRPASKLSVLHAIKLENIITTILLTETSTIGVRNYGVNKTVMDREIKTLNTKYGKVRVKSVLLNNQILKFKPEYDDCVRIAKENKIPLRNVYEEINALFRDELNH